ncbi:MAG: L,D-transpeptidase family protein [Sphingomicrobium sp.]
MKTPTILLAFSALSLPAAASAQYGYPPQPYPPAPMPYPPEAQFPDPYQPVQQAPWGPPQPIATPAVARSSTRKPIEPIDLPPAIQQGVDMIFIDPEIEPSLKQRETLTHEIAFDDFSGAPVDMFLPLNPLYTELRRGLVRYRQRWGDLPNIPVAAGSALKLGSTDPRVADLRERLGLSPGSKFDAQLLAVAKEYQTAHGLKADGIVAAGTINSLNLGPDHYEKLAIVNMERAKRLPLEGERQRYVLVDAGGARLYLYDNGRVVDSMKVIVGAKATATPMMVALLKYSSVNPYWNVPPELVRNLIGPRVVAQGTGYLTEREYQVLSDWTDTATVLDPRSIDWQAVVAGRKEIRLRRLPSPANSMGMIKFMMPNDFGIYLHDTPDKTLFQKDDRWISNGCIRVEDASRLARWLYGSEPHGNNPKKEQDVPLTSPVPVYVTYLTVAPSANGLAFRADPYGRDANVLQKLNATGSFASLQR